MDYSIVYSIQTQVSFKRKSTGIDINIYTRVNRRVGSGINVYVIGIAGLYDVNRVRII